MSAAMVFLPAAVAPFWVGYWAGAPQASSHTNTNTNTSITIHSNNSSDNISRSQLAIGVALASLPLVVRFSRRGARTYVELRQALKMKALTQSLYAADGPSPMHGLKLQRFRNVCLLAGVASLGLGVAASALVNAKDSPVEMRKPRAVSAFGQGVSVLMALPTAYAVVYTPLTMLPVLGVIYGAKYVTQK